MEEYRVERAARIRITVKGCEMSTDVATYIIMCINTKLQVRVLDLDSVNLKLTTSFCPNDHLMTGTSSL